MRDTPQGALLIKNNLAIPSINKKEMVMQASTPRGAILIRDSLINALDYTAM